MNKKTILSLFLAFALVGCDDSSYYLKESGSFKRLNQVDFPSDNKSFEFVDTFQVKPITNFAFESSKSIITGLDNMMYSPLSLYYALAMLSEGVSNQETLASLNNLLNNSNKERQETLTKIYRNNYFKEESGENKIANSFWSKMGLNVKEDFLNSLQNNYYAEVFETDFSKKENKQKIVDWINNNTNNFLNLDIKNYPIQDDISAVLFNTIYFNNSWSEPYIESLTNKKDFTLSDKSVVSTDFMSKTYNSLFYQTDSYKACKDTFNYGYSIEYVLPNDGYSLSDVLSNKDIYNLINGEEYEINLNVPKFKYSNKMVLDDYLKSNGLESLYKDGSLDNIANGLFVSKVQQDTGISLDEKGVEAAAVTSIWMKETAYEPYESKITFTLDKPFIYIVYAAGNIPMFVGAVTNPTKN